jgi:mono/diheme cytochrome c family protein
MRTRLFTLLIAMPLLAAAPAPDGAALWRAHCARCHGADGRAKTDLGRRFSATDLTRPLWQSSRDDAAIRTAILLGTEGGMPAFRAKLSGAEADALVKTIRDFKRASPAPAR